MTPYREIPERVFIEVPSKGGGSRGISLSCLHLFAHARVLDPDRALLTAISRQLTQLRRPHTLLPTVAAIVPAATPLCHPREMRIVIVVIREPRAALGAVGGMGIVEMEDEFF